VVIDASASRRVDTEDVLASVSVKDIAGALAKAKEAAAAAGTKLPVEGEDAPVLASIKVKELTKAYRQVAAGAGEASAAAGETAVEEPDEEGASGGGKKGKKGKSKK